MPASASSDQPGLLRRLGVLDATSIGLASMLGAGVFVVFGPAAGVAGSWLLVGLALAAVVALCNALSSAQLAVAYPVSGGTYQYGTEVLGPWWGFLAGWGFVVGKTASCAAMALTAASYLLPDHGIVTRLAATAVALACGGLNLRGVTRTAQAARVIAGITVSVLLVFIVAEVAAGSVAPLDVGAGTDASAYGVLQSAG
jgi:basic amino acid/polyamine antiporter, APA family